MYPNCWEGPRILKKKLRNTAGVCSLPNNEAEPAVASFLSFYFTDDIS